MFDLIELFRFLLEHSIINIPTYIKDFTLNVHQYFFRTSQCRFDRKSNLILVSRHFQANLHFLSSHCTNRVYQKVFNPNLQLFQTKLGTCVTTFIAIQFENRIFRSSNWILNICHHITVNDQQTKITAKKMLHDSITFLVANLSKQVSQRIMNNKQYSSLIN